jgi:hypothetical protein
MKRQPPQIETEFLRWCDTDGDCAKVRVKIVGRTATREYRVTLRNVTPRRHRALIAPFGLMSIGRVVPPVWRRAAFNAVEDCVFQKMEAEKQRGEQFVKTVCGPSEWGCNP